MKCTPFVHSRVIVIDVFEIDFGVIVIKPFWDVNVQLVNCVHHLTSRLDLSLLSNHHNFIILIPFYGSYMYVY